MNIYKLYALTEPDNINAIKYIGVTKKTLLTRLGQHLCKMEERTTRRDEWLLTLKKAPLIILLKEFDTEKEALKAEKEMITKLELSGVILFNESKNYNRRILFSKKVYQYDLKGNFVEEYNSAKEASVLNIFFKYKCINACCNGTKKTHYGFMFSFNKQKKIEPFKKTPSVIGKKVYQYSLKNEFIDEFKNAYDAANKTNVLQGDIWKCCNKYKNSRTAGGFIWKYDKV